MDVHQFVNESFTFAVPPFWVLHAKIKITHSGVFYLRENDPGFEINIHECASVCKRILRIRCAAFFVVNAKMKFTRSGVFCLRENNPGL